MLKRRGGSWRGADHQSWPMTFVAVFAIVLWGLVRSICHAGSRGGTEIAGLDIVGPVWQGWTMTDDLRTGVIWLVIDVVDQ